MSKLGDRIRELRHQQGLTVRAFADILGKSPGYVSRVEARGEIPSPALLCAMAAALGEPEKSLLSLAKSEQLQRFSDQLDDKQAKGVSLYRRSKKPRSR